MKKNQKLSYPLIWNHKEKYSNRKFESSRLYDITPFSNTITPKPYNVNGTSHKMQTNKDFGGFVQKKIYLKHKETYSKRKLSFFQTSVSLYHNTKTV